MNGEAKWPISKNNNGVYNLWNIVTAIYKESHYSYLLKWQTAFRFYPSDLAFDEKPIVFQTNCYDTELREKNKEMTTKSNNRSIAVHWHLSFILSAASSVI